MELAVLSSPFSPPPPFTEWKKVKDAAPMRRTALPRRTDPIDVEEEGDDNDIAAVVFAKKQCRRHSARLTNDEERIGR